MCSVCMYAPLCLYSNYNNANSSCVHVCVVDVRKRMRGINEYMCVVDVRKCMRGINEYKFKTCV